MTRAKTLTLVFIGWSIVLISCKSSAPPAIEGTKAGETTIRKYTPDQLPKVTGLVVPNNLPELAQRTNKLGAQVVKTVKATNSSLIVGASIDHPDFCSPSASSFDLRTANLVTPIK